MASLSVIKARGARTGVLLSTCVIENGSVTHPWFNDDELLRGQGMVRNLADAIHFLSALHGRYPGVLDHAAGRTIDPAARAWLTGAGEAMIDERNYLGRLSVAAGPIPSTPGGGASQSAVIGQRSALATLAQSERKGCALGAAFAFAIDWAPLRKLLDHAATRFGIEIPHCRLIDRKEIESAADSAGESESAERAMLFGAQQVALQHRGLWDLLEARALARSSA